MTPERLILDYLPPVGDDGQVIGMDVAVDGLQRACLRYAGADRIAALTAAPEVFDHFRRASAQAQGRATPTHLTWHDEAGWDGFGTVLRADPALAPLAWLRERFGASRLSLIGVSHTQSSQEVMAATGGLMAAPLHPWDAIVCPSPAIRDVVRRLLEGHGEHLAERTGGRPPPLPHLPEIPLGIDVARFSFAPAERARIRARFDIPEETTVLLYHGRMSHHTKANPAPLAIAAERLVGRGRKIVLLFHGFFLPDSVEADYRALVGALAPSVPHAFVRHGDPAFPDGLWAGADVFISPVDNIQESFGLTPIEAMAAGLPAVVSDWDGYRATVRDGIDGFLIPTLAPPPGSGADLARRYQDGRDVYGEYIGGVAQTAVVDLDALTRALDRLAADPALRRRMGEAGRARAREVFDWAAIIPRYEALAGELADIRAAAPPCPPRPEPRTIPDPFTLFAAFPTRALAADDVAILVAPDLATIERFMARRAVLIHEAAVADAPTRAKLFNALRAAGGRARIGDLAATLPGPLALRAVLHWAKFGLIRIERG